MNQYTQEYRGYVIRRIGGYCKIYDKNGNYVKQIDSRLIKAAKSKIDEIIQRNR